MRPCLSVVDIKSMDSGNSYPRPTEEALCAAARCDGKDEKAAAAAAAAGCVDKSAIERIGPHCVKHIGQNQCLDECAVQPMILEVFLCLEEPC